jgi:hypothetical protein
MSAVTGLDYTVRTVGDPVHLAGCIEELLVKEAILVERKGRPIGPRRRHEVALVDIRPTIQTLALAGETDACVAIDFRTRMVNAKLAKPREIVELLGLSATSTRVIKRATHLADWAPQYG